MTLAISTAGVRIALKYQSCRPVSTIRLTKERQVSSMFAKWKKSRCYAGLPLWRPPSPRQQRDQECQYSERARWLFPSPLFCKKMHSLTRGSTRTSFKVNLPALSFEHESFARTGTGNRSSHGSHRGREGVRSIISRCPVQRSRRRYFVCLRAGRINGRGDGGKVRAPYFNYCRGDFEM